MKVSRAQYAFGLSCLLASGYYLGYLRTAYGAGGGPSGWLACVLAMLLLVVLACLTPDDAEEA